jgi:hypothetical protein
MLRLFVCTFEGLLRLGDRFTVEQFRQICAASLKGPVSMAELDRILEPGKPKQSSVWMGHKGMQRGKVPIKEANVGSVPVAKTCHPRHCRLRTDA